MAYRAGVVLTNERDGMTHDYTRKEGVEHAETVLPEGVAADWARDRSALWNAAEAAERRKDARVAREFEVALPHELSAEERLEVVRSLATDLANRYGAAVDFAIHAPHEAGDIRNHHAHVMMTTRQVTALGLGDKTFLERENKWLLANNLPTTDMQLRDLRQRWEGIANARLAMAGLDVRIDHRSHMERGLELEPTGHMGVHATQMERRGLGVSRSRLDAEAAKRNAELIREKPEQVLTLITGEKSVFDRRDIARTLHRYINDDLAEFQGAFAKVMASSALVELQAEGIDQATGEVLPARYSTREMVALESGMVAAASRMHEASSHGVDRRHVERAIAAQDAAIARGAGDASARLSDEQRAAISHITGAERIAAVVGFAGAGKSTMLAAAREAWEAQGYAVHGAALSGKAAEGLEESSGIASRTLASWELGWQNEKRQLGAGDVFVIDEAGMVGSRQLARFVNEAETRGAKVVLVGDHEQLQAIGAGAPFRAIAEQVGYVELAEIRRQRVEWQRAASVAFATHRTSEGLAAYAQHGGVSFAENREDARAEVVRDYLADRAERPDGSRVAMAHRRADVRAINDAVRSELQERGELAREGAGALTFQTHDGSREFAPGDRIVFLENNRDLGVKNGMLGVVDQVEPGRIIATLDGKGGERVAVPMNDYQAVDHGYATTIHKNQGATVDRSFVLASGTMDRHLTYVAMTRHRDGVQLYAGRDEFKGPEQLESRLSRSGMKETTLDYTAAFAERRGIAEQLGVRSEIEIAREPAAPGVERPSAERAAAENLARAKPAQDLTIEPTKEPQRAEPEKRSKFAGLKLNARPSPSASPERAEASQAQRQPAQERDQLKERSRSLSNFEQAVDRYARAFSAVDKQLRQNLPVLEAQSREFHAAGVGLDQARVGAHELMRSAVLHDPQTAKVMSEHSGRERVSGLVAGMERERAALADPNVRAERFVESWKGLEAQRKELSGWQNKTAREKVAGQMQGLAQSLERDSQLETVLRARKQDLGINNVRANENLSRELTRSLSRDQGPVLGFER